MSNPPPPQPSPRDAALREARKRYWRANVTVVGILLALWAAVSLGAGILFADTLSAFSIGGAPLGFWMAQQGSIAVFVVLILVYALVMNAVDRRLQREFDALPDAEETPPAGES
ncbi:MAG: DUF4212 domain-containing protein [Planctomycetota bacterium]